MRRRSWVNGFLEVGIWLLFFALLVPAGVVGWAIGRGHGTKTRTVTVSAAEAQKAAAEQASSERQSIEAAPPFSPSDLAADPKGDWITNGGSTMNQRYSPLDKIDTGNVKDLKGVWMTHLRGSATAAKYSAESQPLVYKGVIYVPTGADDVFAVSVKSGQILWEYQAHLNQEINTVCCGWLSRGVALGDGKVYIGQLDGKLVALDQKTGKVVWSTAVGSWRRGQTITNAPLYWDGMVITGMSGGEFSIRGRVTAYDAKTGKERWRFYTIPGPGQVGHNSWPRNNNAWQHGGAPVWQTPAVDPKLGLLYFSTGNASPDLDGSRRAGDDLFTASIVAIDAKTGKYKWHYQQVHHDIWDYDGPSPVVLFDVDVDGKTRHALAQSSKTGWVYILDRETGKPIFPIPEKPVPQLRAQRTAKTQPIPSYDPYIPHTVSNASFKEVAKLARANAKGKPPKITRAKQIYTPFGNQMTVITPGPQGGNNWQPMSFNPKTKLLYVCAQGGVSGYSSSGRFLPKAKQGKVADIGSTLTLTGFGQQPGYFVAIDATSGKIKWSHKWPESCYAGTATTAGGLTFVGRNNGHLQAYDASSGDLLWNFQTGAGANDAPTFFQQDGKEYMVFYAGGNSLAASPHGDNLWLFSLDGKLGPAKSIGAGQGVGHAGEAPAKPTNQGTQANIAAGKSTFADNCTGCHGSSGHGGNGGPDLTSIPSAKNLQRVLAQVTNGGGGMPPFKGTLSQAQIRNVAAYVVKDITGGK